MGPRRIPVIPYVLIKKDYVLCDAGIIGEENKLRKEDNNGRKIVARAVIPQFGEIQINDPVWRVPAILPTGDGGLQIATFTEFSVQDRHKHELCTEVYTVLRGTMQILINDEGPHELTAMDEIVVLPGTVHEVVRKPRDCHAAHNDFALLVRVHAFDCYGSGDKYVQLKAGGRWYRWSDLSHEARTRAYKRQSEVGP